LSRVGLPASEYKAKPAGWRTAAAENEPESPLPSEKAWVARHGPGLLGGTDYRTLAQTGRGEAWSIVARIHPWSRVKLEWPEGA
jgi:hypothetical protein